MRSMKKARCRVLLSAALAALTVLCAAFAASASVRAAASTVLQTPDPAEELRVTVIDYGDTGWGDGAMIESGGECLLMDTYMPQCDEALMGYLRDHGYKKFAIYLSHYHADHFGNVRRIMWSDDFEVTHLYLPEDWYMTATDNDYAEDLNWLAYMGEEMRDAALEMDIPVTYLKGGDSFYVGDALVEVLYGPSYEHPDHDPSYINNNSLVTRVTGGGIRFLTCGDIESEVESAVLEAGIDVSADLFKLNHHGGESSNTDAFLAAVDPSFAYADYNGDSPETFGADWSSSAVTRMMRTANVHSVRYNGSITYRARDGVITVRAERNVKPLVQVYRSGGRGGAVMTYQMYNSAQEPLVTDKMKRAAAAAASDSIFVPRVYR
ncbi:MAG: MBL fold metallo-hydrolase [Lachnospiraceae bacterium]|nr:MBL fold metallo-hydrolase [Lachnospiraceae bacterium]